MKRSSNTQVPFPPEQPASRGNALFLILIAVALFAAVSYAVTQSGREGRSVDRERATILAAQITQYSSLVRQTVTRMLLTGTEAGDLDFHSMNNGHAAAPGANPVATTQDGGAADGVGQDAVFAAEGGGVVLELGIPEAARGVGGAGGGWGINHSNNYTGIGSTANDIVLGTTVTLEVCETINRGLGLPVPPPVALLGISGEAAGCFELGGLYIYYHVMVER